MTRHLHDQLDTLAEEERIGSDQQRTDALLFDRGKRIIDLIERAGLENEQRLSDRCRRCLRSRPLRDAPRIVRVDEDGNSASAGNELAR
jgi:hypothetical protein